MTEENTLTKNFTFKVNEDKTISVIPSGENSIISIEEAAEAVEIVLNQTAMDLVTEKRINRIQTTALLGIADLIKDSFGLAVSISNPPTEEGP